MHNRRLCLCTVLSVTERHLHFPCMLSSVLSSSVFFSCFMQGCWFFAITHIMFSDDVTWAASQAGDMTRDMFVPILFVWVFIGECMQGPSCLWCLLHCVGALQPPWRISAIPRLVCIMLPECVLWKQPGSRTAGA